MEHCVINLQYIVRIRLVLGIRKYLVSEHSTGTYVQA